MKDNFGREIDYMRISVTDKCNLRCKYCMPDGVPAASHEDVLRYEEILRVCSIAVKQGINKFKVTGGEPLVRRGCVDFIRNLKRTPGVSNVTLTTNGILLEENLSRLKDAGIDGINISMDTMDEGRYSAITGKPDAKQVLSAVKASYDLGIKTKVNAVLLEECRDSLAALPELARDKEIDVRFIELMPIGCGRNFKAIPEDEAISILMTKYSDLHPVNERRGNGPARYFASEELKGRIGFISANSHKFCETCNRVRLTCMGKLKPCLCYDNGLDIKSLLRSGASDEEIEIAMKEVIFNKPLAHCFENPGEITEQRKMAEIGG